MEEAADTVGTAAPADRSDVASAGATEAAPPAPSPPSRPSGRLSRWLLRPPVPASVCRRLERNGVARRRICPKLSDEDGAEAADLYRDGLSLVAIGHRYRVNASTVGKALRRAKVQIRPRRGWASA